MRIEYPTAVPRLAVCTRHTSSAADSIETPLTVVRWRRSTRARGGWSIAQVCQHCQDAAVTAVARREAELAEDRSDVARSMDNRMSERVRRSGSLLRRHLRSL